MNQLDFERYPEQPNYFWININQTHLVERKGEYAHQPYGLIWIPEPEETPNEPSPLSIAELIRPGDIIFFYKEFQIQYIGKALNRCYSSKVPPTLIEKGSKNGWRVDVDYAKRVNPPFAPKDHLPSLASFLADENVPLDSEGNPTRDYLIHLQPDLGKLLLKLCHVELPDSTENDGPITTEVKKWTERQSLTRLIADLEEIQINEDLDETQKLLFTDARLGKGKFLREVSKIYSECPVTGIQTSYSVAVCHIKPWRACSDKEKIDPLNGILLAKHIKGLFQMGMITFDQNGLILVSSYLKNDLRSFHLYLPLKIKFPAEVLPYLAWHKEKVFII